MPLAEYVQGQVVSKRFWEAWGECKPDTHDVVQEVLPCFLGNHRGEKWDHLLVNIAVIHIIDFSGHLAFSSSVRPKYSSVRHMFIM